MKIIEILRIIANNKKPPMEIEYDGTKWKYVENEKDYSSEERNEWLFDECIITEILNDYVGILSNYVCFRSSEDSPYILTIEDIKTINRLNKMMDEFDKE